MHFNTKDLTNQTFNYLTAIHTIPKPEHVKSKQLGTWWLCKCECGNERIVRSRELLAGETKSCGCKNQFTSSANFKGVGRVSQTFFSKMVWGAKKRNLEVGVTKQFLWELFEKQKGTCYFSGLIIELNPRDSGVETTASIDRLDSTKGYVEDNVVWVHKNINVMKNVYEISYFTYLCNLVAEKHKKALRI